MRDMQVGTGAVATEGSWASVHYVCKLLGDGTVVEDTRNTGWGDRDYGQPVYFDVGDIGNHDVLRALHPCVLDMRAGGTRRVRVCMCDPDFGYKKKPTLMDSRKWGLKREVANDWLLDIEVTLVDVQKKKVGWW